MRAVLKALAVCDWISPIIGLADHVLTGAVVLRVPVGSRYRSGADIVRKLRAHGIRVKPVPRMVIRDCYVFSVPRQEAEKARRILEG